MDGPMSALASTLFWRCEDSYLSVGVLACVGLPCSFARPFPGLRMYTRGPPKEFPDCLLACMRTPAAQLPKAQASVSVSVTDTRRIPKLGRCICMASDKSVCCLAHAWRVTNRFAAWRRVESGTRQGERYSGEHQARNCNACSFRPAGGRLHLPRRLHEGRSAL